MPAASLTPDALSAEWRVALAAARGALLANERCPTPTLDEADLHARHQRLIRERDEIDALLQADARTQHVRLVRRLALPTATKHDVGLPADVSACLFDLDGVLTTSADVQFAAWAEVFDAFLARRLEDRSVHFSHYGRFSRREDYEEYVAGRPRIDGVRAFLASRGITLPEGRPDDPPDAGTVHGLANRKSLVLRRRLRHEGVAAFDGSRRYLEAAAAAGLATAVTSASAHTGTMLERAGLADLVDLQLDGPRMSELGLRSKPAPDVVLATCELLGIPADRTAVFETSLAGLDAAQAAGARLVVQVVRDEQDVRGASSADIAVRDLTELLQPRLLRAA